MLRLAPRMGMARSLRDGSGFMEFVSGPPGRLCKNTFTKAETGSKKIVPP